MTNKEPAEQKVRCPNWATCDVDCGDKVLHSFFLPCCKAPASGICPACVPVEPAPKEGKHPDSGLGVCGCYNEPEPQIENPEIPRKEFLRLPIEERRRILGEQVKREGYRWLYVWRGILRANL